MMFWMALAALMVAAQTVKMVDRKVFVRAPNYDETKIEPYELEDPLVFLDGRKVTRATWPERRKEILNVFAKEMYGAEPPDPESLVTELVDEKVSVAGFAIRRQYKMWFKDDKSGPCLNWVVWIPRHAKKAVPLIAFLNFRGNHELVPDSDIPVTEAWLMNWDEKIGIMEHRANPKNRGIMQGPDQDTVFPVGMIIARGYAIMSACYAEVSSDPDALSLSSVESPTEGPSRWRRALKAYDGVFSLWGPRDLSRTDNITALGAWSWALSRGLDLAERIKEIDAKKTVVTGCSRLGKAALVAAARDERFSVCVPIQTGGGGVPLAKRDFGENVSTENRMFPHWYCSAYAKYAQNPARSLPFDQHLFLSCIAPRALLVEGFGENWFDTKGEYLSVRAASPVWELFYGRGLPAVGWPDEYDKAAIGDRLGYVRRSEAHGISAYEWTWMMNFADKVFE